MQFLEKISQRGIRRGLERMQEAARILEHPEKRYKTIHIAGTNGKGSTCVALSKILMQSGYKVGLTLSPHVDDYRERIQVSDDHGAGLRLISPDELLAVHQELLEKITTPLTYFEWSTLLAFVYFSKRDLDFVVLETGMGGRWDATNICDSLLSAITTIGFDHMAYLGNTLESILTEKLHIVKKNSHFVFAPRDEKLVSQAKAFCLGQNAEFYAAPKTVQTKNYLEENIGFAWHVAEVLRRLGYAIKKRQLLAVSLPARYEKISEHPLIILDGSHNEQGIKKLLEMHGGLKDTIVVFGCLADRDFLSLAKLVVGKQNYWARFAGGERTTADAVYAEVRCKLGGYVVSLNLDFVRQLVQQGNNQTILVCGSFQLCSQFRQCFAEFKRGI